MTEWTWQLIRRKFLTPLFPISHHIKTNSVLSLERRSSEGSGVTALPTLVSVHCSLEEGHSIVAKRTLARHRNSLGVYVCILFNRKDRENFSWEEEILEKKVKDMLVDRALHTARFYWSETGGVVLRHHRITISSPCRLWRSFLPSDSTAVVGTGCFLLSG